MTNIITLVRALFTQTPWWMDTEEMDWMDKVNMTKADFAWRYCDEIVAFQNEASFVGYGPF